MSSIIKKIIHKHFTYNQTLHFPKAIQQQKTIQKIYDALVKNYTWDIVYILKDQKIFKEKLIYKIKKYNKGIISKQKARWIAKSFEQ